MMAIDTGLKVEVALLALKYGDVEGAHHKQWLIDQMLREALGGAGYQEFLNDYVKRVGKSWDEGIAP